MEYSLCDLNEETRTINDNEDKQGIMNYNTTRSSTKINQNENNSGTQRPWLKYI